MYHSLSVSGILTMELHALNNEGTEGNVMMTRMVEIIDKDGARHTVNAVSGDMFKHIQAEHLHSQAKALKLPLCKGCELLDANRISADEGFHQRFKDETSNEKLLDEVIKMCVLDDCEGNLITSIGGKNRSLARKSCVEFGWVVGVPDKVTTDTFIHTKYAAEREKGSGEAANLGQNIFHRPASSGQYAVVLCADLFRVGRNDINLNYVLEETERKKRIGALLTSILLTFTHPSGAQRNTQNPHIVDFCGVLTTSRTPVPAPCVSALNTDFITEITQICEALHGLGVERDSLSVVPFNSLSDFAQRMGEIIQTTLNGDLQ